MSSYCITVPVHGMNFNLVVIRSQAFSEDRVYPRLGEFVLHKDSQLLIYPAGNGSQCFDGELSLFQLAINASPDRF